jgi:hypothetical protein
MQNLTFFPESAADGERRKEKHEPTGDCMMRSILARGG